MYKVQIRVDKDTQKCQQTEQKPSKKHLIQVKVSIIKEFFLTFILKFQVLRSNDR